MNTTKMLSTLHTLITVSLLALCDGVMETVVGVAGRTVSLTCRYDLATLGLTEVCWGRGAQPSLFGCENTVIATNGVEVTYRRSNRHRLPGKLRSGDVSLTIYNVGEGDSGFYHCRVALSGLFNDLTQTVHLIVRQAPVVPTLIPTVVPTVIPTVPAQLLPITDTPGSSVIPENNRQALVIPTVIPTIVPTTTEQPLPITETSVSPYTPVKSTEGEQGPDILYDCTTGPIIGLVKGIKKMASPSLESYIGHTVRVGAIAFIPGLILAVLLRLRRSRNSRVRGEPASSSSVISRNPRVEIPLSHHDTDAWIYDAPTDV
ncbi:hepatitis A virus cellular receptor 1 isoform X2 [Salmo salar]|uniref:Hepatitis A virus cellular receptor 1 isoform X2 n=1 Tax=Salmo salar TaxID=8030 RepID=A0A1S3LML3_SALSA|nr:hepatitis A virus cellular receptor 1 isoform X2 [Salmo salar]|eukprot:XP_013992223.1 PREDICTED: hepatitis A virus cellular receptor 1-like isoform X2 [Salmo salar]